MKHSILFCICLTTLLLVNCSPKTEKFLEIEGTVTSSEIKSILLEKPGEYILIDDVIEIPVEDGKFYYKEKLNHPQIVDLYLGVAKKNSGGRAMKLFLENEKIKLTIHPEEEFDKNTVEGGSFNAEYKRYKLMVKDKFEKRTKTLNDSLSVLYETNQYSSNEMKKLRSKLSEAKSHEEEQELYEEMAVLRSENRHLSPQVIELNDKLEPVLQEKSEFKEDYIVKNPSLVSYSYLIDELIWKKEKVDIDLAKKQHKVLSKANPNHPYNEFAANYISAIENIKVGKKYTDFTAPDLDGNEVKISDKIDGKVALLDLWATWCGSCISYTRSMVPVYEDYKDKGFTIVGVANEFNNTEKLERTLDRENWKWLNLVELDRQNKIWEKYGIVGSSGGIFLIDENGIILAKNPSAEEVRKELEARLN